MRLFSRPGCDRNERRAGLLTGPFDMAIGVPAGAVDPIWFGLHGFNWPPVIAGGQVADPGYFTLAGFAMPWAGMGVIETVTAVRTGDLEWDQDDADGELNWDQNDAAGVIQWGDSAVPALTWE